MPQPARRSRSSAATERVGRAAAFSPDGSRVVTASVDETARIWDAASGQEIAVFGGLEWVWSAAFSPDGTRIVTGSKENAAIIWDVTTARNRNARVHKSA